MNAPESPLNLSPDAAAATTACYHCGLPVDGPVRYRVRVAGEDRPMCCAGCAAVAEAISGGGLDAFYAHRDALPEAAPDGGARDLSVYDLPEVQADFVRILETPPMTKYDARDRNPIDLNDDDALERLIRARADTIYHPVGTARMGSDEGAVCDPKLRVRGVTGLYIADASIMPKLISGNTNAPSIMIGERCADFILADLA